MKRFFLCALAAILFLGIAAAGVAASSLYIGNKNRMVYHTADCTQGQQTAPENRVYFYSRESAERSGYRRCDYCGDDIVEPGNGGGTGNGAGPSSGSSNSGSSSNQTIVEKPQTENRTFWEEVWEVVRVILIIVCVAAWPIVISLPFSAIYQTVIWLKKRKQGKIRQARNKEVLAKLGCGDADIPTQVVLLEDGTPTIGEVSATRPFGDYTVFVADNGRRIHKNAHCCKNSFAYHIFDIPECLVPCKRCATKLNVPTVPSWYLQIKGKRTENGCLNKDERKEEKNTQVHSLESSLIKRAEYCDGVLYLTFAGGSVYAYYNLPTSVFEGLLKSSSPASYYHESIKGKYPEAPYHNQ
ncbi:MAG: KTSC domain-containing protein [Oscillospiraceae bacterium]|nr:KTSC domain-containing protein [Oscillospiraceae bacterium]